jgi:uncharacterized glyoxalase superfamily protein PhnB
MAVKAIPDGYSVITPYLIVRGAARAIDFYTKVLGGSEIMRMPGPGDRIGHAEIRFGDSVVMLADEVPEMVIMSPEKYGGSPVSLMIYVQDVDAVFNRAIAAGQNKEADPEPILRRPLRHPGRSIRPHLDHRDSCRGRLTRRDHAPNGRDETRVVVQVIEHQCGTGL